MLRELAFSMLLFPAQASTRGAPHAHKPCPVIFELRHLYAGEIGITMHYPNGSTGLLQSDF